MNVSETGIELIKKFEGCVLKVEFNLSGYDEKFYEELAHSFDEYEKEKPLKTKIKCPNCGLEIEV